MSSSRSGCPSRTLRRADWQAYLDNAVAERFFGSLKQEWTAHCHYATRQEARDDIIAYIEMFYNSRRKHSSLGYVSPNEDEKFARVA